MKMKMKMKKMKNAEREGVCRRRVPACPRRTRGTVNNDNDDDEGLSEEDP